MPYLTVMAEDEQDAQEPVHGHRVKTNMKRMAPRVPKHEATVVPVYTFTSFVPYNRPVGTTSSTQSDKGSCEAARNLIENAVDLAG